MRLIDADAFDMALKNAQNQCRKKSGGNFRFGFLSTVRANLEAAPTIDAVPVVRCKDCKYWGQDDPAGDGCECNRIGGWWLPEDYCSCGERGDTDG